MSSKKNLRDNIHIVLVKPRHVGNIGSTARAMNNMGFSQLVLVDPAPYDVPETYMMGWNSEEIIRKAKEYPSLKDALKKYHFVLGTTRRKGKARNNLFPLETVLEEMVSVAKKNKVAVLFGTESTGLLNEELDECHKFCFIDTHEIFPSLNLAQAVLLVCYEIHKRIRKETPRAWIKLAKREQIDHMYDHIDLVLKNLGYDIKGNRPLRKQILKRVRTMFSRSMLERKDVQMVRGLCKQVEKQLLKKRK